MHTLVKSLQNFKGENMHHARPDYITEEDLCTLISFADVNSHKVQARNKTAFQENILSATNIRILGGGVHQTYTACCFYIQLEFIGTSSAGLATQFPRIEHGWPQQTLFSLEYITFVVLVQTWILELVGYLRMQHFTYSMLAILSSRIILTLGGKSTAEEMVSWKHDPKH